MHAAQVQNGDVADADADFDVQAQTLSKYSICQANE
jgi:hypothetical protein